VEGIYDGAARDDCFLCALVEPERYADDCPRCHKRMRYQPAVRMDAPTLERQLGDAVDRYRRAGNQPRQALEDLLTLLHRFSPDALIMLEERSLSLDELRAAWRALGS
jgi:hypothetical protein